MIDLSSPVGIILLGATVLALGYLITIFGKIVESPLTEARGSPIQDIGALLVAVGVVLWIIIQGISMFRR